MSDAPILVGRNRIQPTARPLGSAVPVSTRAWGEPVELVVPKTAQELRGEREARRDAQPISTRCGFCDWTHDGTAGEGREAAKQHREQAHPEAAKPRARRTARMTPRSRRTPEEQAQGALDAAEANRARMEREDAARLEKVLRGRRRMGLGETAAGAAACAVSPSPTDSGRDR